MSNITHGDFTKLADKYAQYRPAYSPFVLDATLGLIDKNNAKIDFADVGAGTGIWTRMVASQGCQTTAVEPNENMRTHGIQQSDKSIEWLDGQAEKTGLRSSSKDLLTMASSFHWTDFDQATAEFARVLRPGGIFMATWNTRLIEVNPLLVEIEKKLHEIIPDLKRVSSGRSEFTSSLQERLRDSPNFEDAIYIEGQHIERQTPAHYIGLWRSVNDIQAQAGAERFEQFISFIQERIRGIEHIEATYLTRAWIARTYR